MPDDVREVVAAARGPDCAVTESVFQLPHDWSRRLHDVAQALAYRTKEGQVFDGAERFAIQGALDYLQIAQKNDARNAEALRA